MSLSVCVQGLVAEGRVSQGQAKQVEEVYGRQFDLLKGQMGMMAAAELASERAIRIVQATVERRKLLAALTIKTQERITEQLHGYNSGKMAGGDGKGPIDPGAGPALLGGQDARATYGTLEGRHKAVQGQIDAMMREVLLRHGPDAIGRIRDKAGLDDLGREAFGQDTGNANAKQGAEAWNTALEWSRARVNANGGAVAKLSDYGLRMHWDSTKVRLLPDYETFRTKVLPELAGERMIDHETGQPFVADRLDQVMQDAWRGIRSNGWDEREPGSVGKPSMVNSDQDPRFFVFKDYDAWSRVNDALGNGNAFTAMNGLLEHRARTIAALETLGPNPDHTVQWLKDTITKSAETDDAASLKAPEAAAKSNKAVDRMWQEYKGTLNLPESKAIASFFGTIRNVKSSAALGSALISQLSDIGLQASARAYNGLPEVSLLADYWRFLKPGVAEDREFAARQLLGLEEQRHYTAVQTQLFGREFAKPWSQRMVSTVMNLQGSARWAQAGRHGFGFSWWNTITSARGKDWAALDPAFRGAMTRGGFDAVSWDALRATPTEDYKGTPWIFADNIDNYELRMKAAEMVLTQAQTVLPIPDLRTRAAMNNIVKRGTIVGELLRGPMMFKGFGVAIVMNQLQRMMTMPAGSAVRYAARFAVGMTLLGGLEMQLRNITKGKDPEPIDPGSNPGFWGHAAMTGGTGGIFSDYLKEVQADPTKGTLAFAAGPMAEDVENASHIFIKNDHGHAALNDKPGAPAFKFARTLVPGGSIWYARLAFDRMIADEVQQLADPNYRQSHARMTQYAREQGTQFWWKPGETTPERAPDLSNATNGAAP